MKPIGIILVFAVALVAGVVGAGVVVALTGPHTLAVSAGEQAAAPRTREDASSAAARSAATTPDGPSAEVEGLRLRVEDLTREVADLRASMSRQAAPTSADAKAPVAVEQLAAVQRDAVVKIMEEQRQLEQQKRDDERKAREQQMYNQFAERAAKDLGLSPADQAKLVDFIALQSTKRDELFRSARDNPSPETMRASWEEFRTWRDTELQNTFGADLAKQLTDYTRQQGRDGMGMMFGGGPGGFDGGGNRGGNPGDSQSGGQGGQTRGRRGGGGGN